ncbi:MAG: LamG domain-containing protein, partial [Nitrospira sp.]|nr:LamG domain-containing protein [Nitrospira sp.]
GLTDQLITGANDGNWHHVAFVYNGSNTLTTYKDGVQNTQNTTQNPNISGSNFRVGSQNGGSKFTGHMDDFRVWSTARTAAEILASYNQELYPGLTVTATVGTAKQEFTNATGTGGNGIEAGHFKVKNELAGTPQVLEAIEIEGLGTGDHTTAYTTFELWRDNNANGTYEFASDTQIGTSVIPAGSPAKSLFNIPAGAEQDFTGGQTKEYFIIVKLAGTAASGQTLEYKVSDITVPIGNDKGGVPSATMAGIEIIGPTLDVVATVGNYGLIYPGEQGPGGNGYEAATFELSSDANGAPTLNSITIEGTGFGGDHTTAYTSFEIWRDDNATGIYENASDVLVGSGTFSGSPATTTINVTGTEQNFTASQTKQYFIVIKLNTTPAPNNTFDYIITDIGVGTLDGKTGLPSATMPGVAILPATFQYADNSLATPQSAFLSTSGNVVQQFTISYPGGPANQQTGLTIAAVGTGDDLNDVTAVELWLDDGDSVYNAAVDTLVDTKTFSADNGTCDFVLGAPASSFVATDSKDFFITLTLGSTAANGATFKTYIQGSSGHNANTNVLGLPTPSGAGTAGLEILATNLNVILHGPGAASTINNNSTGPTGDGEVVLDFSLEASTGGSWSVTSVTFAADGTGDDALDIASLTLFEDANANGTFDGAGTDIAAGSANTFTTDNGTMSISLSSQVLNAGTARRFFLAATMAGTASSGETFNARVESVTGNGPVGGAVSGAPSLNSTALVIDTATLTAARGASTPSNTTLESGNAIEFMLMDLELTASNDNITVNGLTFTTGG